MLSVIISYITASLGCHDARRTTARAETRILTDYNLPAKGIGYGASPSKNLNRGHRTGANGVVSSEALV